MHQDKDGKDISIRQLRAAELVRKALTDVFFKRNLPNQILADLSVTVSEVRVSADLKTAIAFVAPLGCKLDSQVFLDEMKKVTPFLRSLVTKKINFKYSPELMFRYDESFDQAVKIQELIKEVIKE
jgi:ribosome-binding factor A